MLRAIWDSAKVGVKTTTKVFKEKMSDEMVTSLTTTDNKEFYKNEDNIFLSKLHVDIMKDKLGLYKDIVQLLNALKISCMDYCIINKIELGDDDERRDAISCDITLYDISYNKVKLLLEIKDFLNIQIFLEANGQKEILDISSISKDTVYDSLYIRIFDIINCFDCAIDIYDIYIQEIDYTLQSIYKYNNSIERIDDYSLRELCEDTTIASEEIPLLWEKIRFSNELHYLVKNEIDNRLDNLDENSEREEAFMSDKNVSFPMFLIRDINFLNKYIKDIKATHSINKDKNGITVQIQIRRLEDTLDLIDIAADEISQDVIKLLEPIGKNINK